LAARRLVKKFARALQRVRNQNTQGMTLLHFCHKNTLYISIDAKIQVCAFDLPRVRNVMVARVGTIALYGIDVKEIDVQVQMSSGLSSFSIVGLPDKAVAESRERVRAALTAIGLALPPKRITVNLAPADLLKEGSHFDLPIALGLLLAMGVLPPEEMEEYFALGELALDGQIAPVAGVLPAAIAANRHDRGLICPASCGGEAAWAGEDLMILAAPSLLALINHFKGLQLLTPPEPKRADGVSQLLDMKDVKGQETAKRALEVAAAGGHNMLMVGPPGAGKSMLAARLPGILPSLSPEEALDVSMIQSVAGVLADQGLMEQRPFRDPHHSASLPALIGGGTRAKPGEISLAHHGVLFLDELPEFSRPSLEALRQPLETGRAVISRANHHVSYPARLQLIAAMNPCRCGHLADPEMACSRAPKCARDYVNKLSGPFLDRIDIILEVQAIRPADLALPPAREDSNMIAKRVAKARAIQRQRYEQLLPADPQRRINASADGDILEAVACLEEDARRVLLEAAEKLKLSARGYHRILRVARTLADLEAIEVINSLHVSEAIHYRRRLPGW